MRITVLAPFALAALAALPGRATAQDSTPAQPPPAPVPAPVEVPAPAQAAQSSTAISPGMTEMDVRNRWGDPVATRTAGQWKFLYYRNDDERHVGWLDTVFLQNGQVMDVIARGAGHDYTGQSSSPVGRTPERTVNPAAATDTTKAAVTGVHISP
jgi:outer membrane protein assembly factor BamE (lipoprotein component of BamABCDE complex)